MCEEFRNIERTYSEIASKTNLDKLKKIRFLNWVWKIIAPKLKFNKLDVNYTDIIKIFITSTKCNLLSIKHF